MKLKKQFSLEWAFEPFQDDPSFFSKRMFGGLSAYKDGRIVMVLTENPGEQSWRGKNYAFDIWNGILFPTERKHHPAILKDFPSLVPHPVLPKWLYLPMTVDDFEAVAEIIAKLIGRNDVRFGVIPKAKDRKSTRLKMRKQPKKNA